MKTLCILFFINLFTFICCLHLNSHQLTLINNLVTNPLLKIKDREKINLILYKAYEKYAIKQAIEFKTLHKYKCANIKIDELIFYSKMGLFKSIKKYNGNKNFINYFNIYIKYELLGLLTEKYSLSVLPKSIRRKNKSTFTKTELMKYNFILNTKMISQYENWKIELMFSDKEDSLNKLISQNEYDEKMHNLFKNLSAFSKRVFYLKYYLQINKNLSNKSISKLLCCSEETVRKQIIEIKQKANIL